MRNHSLVYALTGAVVVSAACGEVEMGGPFGIGNTAPPTSHQVGDGTIPCDVAEVLSSACWGCHSGANTLGDTSLDKYDALVAPSLTQPALTVVELSVERMKDTASPMPPGGGADAADIAVLEAWIADGMPKGECGTEGNPVQGETPIVCTSGTYWTEEDDEGSKDMSPGMACIACHEAEDEGPSLLFGGTVYPTLHEPDDCNGSPGGVEIVVTDAANRQFAAIVRASGNFSIEGDEDEPLAFPIRAEVRRGGKVLQMKDPVDSADCNACHTVEGADGAAGRIVAP